MTWEVTFYGDVQTDILNLPPKLQARMIRLLEMIEKHGANLGEPHTKSLGDGLFEIRAKAKEGIARGLYCYRDGQEIKVLHVFQKKTQKTPKKDLDLARDRLREIKNHESQRP